MWGGFVLDSVIIFNKGLFCNSRRDPFGYERRPAAAMSDMVVARCLRKTTLVCIIRWDLVRGLRR